MKTLAKRVGSVLANLGVSRSAARWHDYKGPYLTFRNEPPWPEDLKQEFLRDLVVFPEFITQAEHDQLAEEATKALDRQKYQHDHFDKVISGYKEVEKSFWKEPNTRTLQKVRAAFPPEVKWLPAVHIIDLMADGPLGAHVDHPDYSGGIISGLSLLSPSVMTFANVNLPEQYTADALLLPRSLYIMRRKARYDFSHEIAAHECEWMGEKFPRGRRISIMFRDEHGNTVFGG